MKGGVTAQLEQHSLNILRGSPMLLVEGRGCSGLVRWQWDACSRRRTTTTSVSSGNTAKIVRSLDVLLSAIHTNKYGSLNRLCVGVRMYFIGRIRRQCSQVL